MIRSAAKNHDDVVVIVDVERLPGANRGIAARRRRRPVSHFRRRMAQKAFARTAAYDAAISNWLAQETHEPAPKWRAFGGVAPSDLWRASLRAKIPTSARRLYLSAEARPGVATARQMQGKELSYNNINDTDAAYELVAEFDPSGKRRRWPSLSTRTLAASLSASRCWRPTKRR